MAENEQLEGQMNIYDFLPGSKNKILWEEWHKKYDKQEVNIKGLMDDGYCPKCDANLNDLIDECPYCKTKLDWSHWIKLNYDFLTPAQKYYIETGRNDYWQRGNK